MLQLFDLAKVYNLEGSQSDHSSLLFCPETRIRAKRNRKFRFENAWLTEPMCFQIVKDCWEEDNSCNILQKVNKCAENLDVWGREITGYFSRRIKECKIKLKSLRNKRDAHSVAEFANAKKQLFLVLDQKEIFWGQRSKQLWLQAGEKNTKYFHASCSKRKRNNLIQNLKNAEGDWIDWRGGLRDLIKDYFQQLFTEEPNKVKWS